MGIYESIFKDSLEIRNDDRIRKLFAEIICFLSLSKPSQWIESVKISSLILSQDPPRNSPTYHHFHFKFSEKKILVILKLSPNVFWKASKQYVKSNSEIESSAVWAEDVDMHYIFMTT